MTLLSYVVGQIKNPIPYDLKRIGGYAVLTLVLFVAGTKVEIDNIYLRLAYRTILLLLYVTYILKRDLPLKDIPYINRLIKK